MSPAPALAVIPARGGSRRIPRKNVRPFCGRPMIAWSIEAARDSGCFERVVVSTEDAEIAEIARACGAETPFRRDPALADDHTPTIPVIAEAARRLELAPETPVCCVYAAAPFVRGADLAEGLSLLREREARFVTAVATFPHPIQRALSRAEDGAVRMIDASRMTVRSQDLEEAWHDAGQFYWARARDWTAPGAAIFDPGAYGLALPRWRVQDIDTPEDWERAERLMRAARAEAPAGEASA